MLPFDGWRQHDDLACTARRVLRPLTIAGLMPLFDIHETLDGALAET